jgi:hypothetical protein
VIEPALPPEVRDLIRRRLRNMEEIEVLLLLAASGRAMSLEEICAGLRIPASALPHASVERLIANELIEAAPNGTTPHYRYAPGSADLRKAVTLLAASYNERPVSLVRLVYHRDESASTFT